MDFNDFKAELAKGIQSELDDRGMKTDVEFHHVDKMNQSYDAITVRPEDSNVGVDLN